MTLSRLMFNGDPDKEPCARCKHPRDQHWTYYGGMSGCQGTLRCDCETFVTRMDLAQQRIEDPGGVLDLVPAPVGRLPVARVLVRSWWARLWKWLRGV